MKRFASEVSKQSNDAKNIRAKEPIYHSHISGQTMLLRKYRNYLHALKIPHSHITYRKSIFSLGKTCWRKTFWKFSRPKKSYGCCCDSCKKLVPDVWHKSIQRKVSRICYRISRKKAKHKLTILEQKELISVASLLSLESPKNCDVSLPISLTTRPFVFPPAPVTNKKISDFRNDSSFPVFPRLGKNCTSHNF